MFDFAFLKYILRFPVSKRTQFYTSMSQGWDYNVNTS